LFEGREAEALVLRANALERTNHGQQAFEQLLTAYRDAPWMLAAAQKVVTQHGKLELCPASHRAAHARVVAEIDAALRPPRVPATGPAALALARACC